MLTLNTFAFWQLIKWFTVNHIRIILLTLLLLIIFSTVKQSNAVQAEKKNRAEYWLKAALMRKFIRHIDWPADSKVADISIPFKICTIGKDPFGSHLESVFKKVNIKKKSAKINRSIKLNKVINCDLLYISHSERKNLDEILKLIRGKSILTISDTKGYTDRGVMINIYNYKKSLRFQINYEVVKQNPLHFSYRILHLAKIVNK